MVRWHIWLAAVFRRGRPLKQAVELAVRYALNYRWLVVVLPRSAESFSNRRGSAPIDLPWRPPMPPLDLLLVYVRQLRLFLRPSFALVPEDRFFFGYIVVSEVPFRLHSAGHLLDACLLTVGLGHLQPGKAYHFPDGPFVEYKGTIPQNELQNKQELELEANALIFREGKQRVLNALDLVNMADYLIKAKPEAGSAADYLIKAKPEAGSADYDKALTD